MSSSIPKRFCHIKDCIEFHSRVFLFTGINSPITMYAIAFKSRWIATSASIPHSFWQVTHLQCCIDFYNRIFFWSVYSHVSMYAVVFKSQWMASNASMPYNFWHVTLMACLHQSKRDFAIYRAVLTSIKGLFLPQGIFPLFHGMQLHSNSDGWLLILQCPIKIDMLLSWNVFINL